MNVTSSIESRPQWRSPWIAPPVAISGAADVRVLVLSGYGLNTEQETAAGFRMVGARPEIVHVADLAGPEALRGYPIIVFTGGFSFGDHIASGRVLANRLRFTLADALVRHVDDGGLVLGICNGFQSIVKLGLLPAVGRVAGGPLATSQVSLVSNDRLGYRDAWVRLAIDAQSPCVFTRGSSGTPLFAPCRHGEGKLVISTEIAGAVATHHLIAVRYVDERDEPTQQWPDNPNGSPGGAAGLCDVTGRVFGLMPHPEAYIYPTNHPDWLAQREAGQLPQAGHGLGILANGVQAVLESSSIRA